jgi:histidyl-tRNA synthetase
MRDFSPRQMIVRQTIIGMFREIFERHGFEPIDTPALEYFETLTGNYADNEKLIYHFPDHGGREIALRYDLTVPMARFVALHQKELNFPFKRYHIAPVWRADRPQRGRYREFWQCDADIVGVESMLADADVVSIIVEALAAVNMPNAVVHINHRKLLEAVAIYAGVAPEQAGSVYRSIDKLDKVGPEGVVEELQQSGVGAVVAGRIVDLISMKGTPDELLRAVDERLVGIERADIAISELEQLFEYLGALGVAESKYTFDLALARGLGYYTGPVYEATVTEPQIGSLAGAGRYDGLIGRFQKQDIPATGISLGLERIIDVVEELGLIDVPRSISQVLVTIFNEETVNAALTLTAELRQAGLRAETFLDPTRNLGRQLQYADRRGIPFALVLGPDEIANGVVAVKDLASGEQVGMPREEAAGYILARLSG